VARDTKPSPSALSVKERPNEPNDLASVIEIYTVSIRSLAASYYSPEQIAAWAPVPPDAARWQERLSHLHTIVAETDGVLAGFASYTHDDYLDFLFTHPAFARRGVATKLYQLIESALRAAGAPGVTNPRQSCRPAIFRPPWLPTRCGGVRRVPRRLLRRSAMHKQLRNEHRGVLTSGG